MKQVLREWYLYVPPISWAAVLLRYVGRLFWARRPKPKSPFEGIDRNMDDVDFNIKIIIGNVIFIGIGQIIVILLRIGVIHPIR